MACRIARWFLLLSSLLCLVASGCGRRGERTVPARGRVIDAGRPLEVQGRDLGLGMVVVQFYRIGKDGRQSTDPEEAQVDAEGNFKVPGRNGKGIPPGKYRIAVRQWDPYPQVDRLKGRFDEKNSPIVREISAQGEIVIDVSKPQG